MLYSSCISLQVSQCDWLALGGVLLLVVEKSFLAPLNYYGKFIPNLSTLIQPMTALLHRDATWEWSEKCQSAFGSAKTSLQSDKLLVHFYSDLQIILACDASPYAVGAVSATK